jgi:hypothetical protein
MILSDFASKLRKCNPRLYIRGSGIYLEHTRRKISTANLSFATEEQRKALSDDRDQFICGVVVPFVPEYDLFPQNSLLRALPGWRSILIRLVQRNLVPLSRARKHFSASLGEADYDWLSYEEKKRLINA